MPILLKTIVYSMKNTCLVDIGIYKFSYGVHKRTLNKRRNGYFFDLIPSNKRYFVISNNLIGNITVIAIIDCKIGISDSL